jgi:4-amino-4-deoxy-L-arabinose transferase-like glycosyltransferase
MRLLKIIIHGDFMEQLIINNENKNLSFIKKNWYIITLILIAMLSFFFNFYAISKYGYGNEYYAAAIKSMTQSFKNFFFVSFDPSGMVSIDKPPVGFWLQAISVLIFGYHGWAMLLPQALAGTGSCIMIYVLTSKHFGRPAGLISSFIFSFTPAVVVASRNNTIDMQLIFVLLIATWFLFKSIENCKKRDLFIAGALIGLGFNIKMLQAYLVLPAFALVYLVFAKENLVKKFINGIITIVIVAVVSFSWVFAVDLYPSDSRPYVDSSTNNTVIELIIGHNGLERIYGQGNGAGNSKGNVPGNMDAPNSENGAPPAMPNQNYGNNNGSATNIQTTTPLTNPDQDDLNGGMNVAPQDGQQDGQRGRAQDSSQGGLQDGGMGMSGGEIGTASILRLWNSNLYGQISWLLTLAVCSILVYIRKFNIRKLTLKQGVLTFWGLWLGTMFTFFSFAGFFHRYYLCMFAPAIAALCGIGIIKMFEEFRNKNNIKQFMLPISLIITIVIQIKYVLNYTQLKTWLIPIIAITGSVSLLLMILNYIRPKKITIFIIGAFMLISILAAPFYWALTPVMYVPNATMPYAGPELASQGGGETSGAGMPQGGSNMTSEGNMAEDESDIYQSENSSENKKESGLEEYLVNNYKEGSFLVVSQRASDVAQYIMDTGLSAYGYGGFLGSDNSLTLDKLKEYVAEGKIRYFFVSEQGMGGNSNSDLISYIKENATLIDPSEYGQSSNANNSTQKGGPGGGNDPLYYFNN